MALCYEHLKCKKKIENVLCLKKKWYSKIFRFFFLPDNNGMILSIGLGVSGLVVLLLTTIIVVLFYLRRKAEQHKKRQQIENDATKRLRFI